MPRMCCINGRKVIPPFDACPCATESGNEVGEPAMAILVNLARRARWAKRELRIALRESWPAEAITRLRGIEREAWNSYSASGLRQWHAGVEPSQESCGTVL